MPLPLVSRVVRGGEGAAHPLGADVFVAMVEKRPGCTLKGRSDGERGQ